MEIFNANPATSIAAITEEARYNYGELSNAIRALVNLIRERNWRRLCIERPNPDVDSLCLVLAALYTGTTVSLLNTRLKRETLKEQKNLLAPDYVFSEGCLLPDSSEETQALPPRWSPDGKLILFTSGSRGSPKAVVIPTAAILKHIEASNERTGLNQSTRWLVSLPFYHVGGLMIPLRILAAGGSVRFLNSLGRTMMVESIRSDKLISHISLVPEMLQDLLELDASRELQNLKMILLGGAPVSQGLLEKIKRFELPVWIGYGSTETCSHISLGTLKDQNYSINAAGRLLSNVSVRTIDEEGKECHPGETGQLLVSSHTLCSGYLDEGRAEQLKSFKSQDLAKYTDNGLYIEGRIDDVIFSGGEKINPSEIQNALAPFVCAVVGFDHPRWGQRPVIFFPERQEGREDSFLSLVQSLPRLHQPDIIIKLSELPTTPTGKISQHSLKTTYRKIVAENWPDRPFKVLSLENGVVRGSST